MAAGARLVERGLTVRTRPAPSRIARIAAIALIAPAFACSFLRSLDDLGNGVHAESEASVDGDAANDAPFDGVAADVAVDAPVVCGPEIDLETDAKNCGVCGNACHDSDACEVGACTFASSTNETSEVALGGGWLVYNDGRAIWARQTSGGDRIALASPPVDVVRIATDGVDAVWTADTGSSGTVYRCPIAGCPGGPVVVASGQNHPRGIALDGKGRVYWATSGGAVAGGTLAYRCTGSSSPRPLGMVRSANLDGSNQQDVITLPDATSDSITDLSQVVLHGPYVYWTNDNCGYTGGSSKAHIWRQLLDGGALTQVFLVPGNGCHWNDLVADDTDLHYACEYTRVASTAQAPQSPERVWAGEPNLELPRATSDGVRVFWTDSDPGVADASVGSRNVYAIAKTAMPGKTIPTLLWTKNNRNKGLRGIAVDDHTIYFADPDERKIRALAK